MKSINISVYIEAPPSRVYAFASHPANFPLWVPSFFKSVEYVDGQWVAQTPEGQVTFAFVEENPYGVLDHTITFASGMRITNPMRVIANGRGSELMFTLIQNENMSDPQFEEDISLVKRDLEALRRIMESNTQ